MYKYHLSSRKTYKTQVAPLLLWFGSFDIILQWSFYEVKPVKDGPFSGTKIYHVNPLLFQIIHHFLVHISYNTFPSNIDTLNILVLYNFKPLSEFFGLLPPWFEYLFGGLFEINTPSQIEILLWFRKNLIHVNICWLIWSQWNTFRTSNYHVIMVNLLYNPFYCFSTRKHRGMGIYFIILIYFDVVKHNFVLFSL